MPIGPESLCLQSVYGVFQEVFVLKAASGQNHALFCNAPRDLNDGLHKCIVEFYRDPCQRNFIFDILEDREDHWFPVHNRRRLDVCRSFWLLFL